ncbi:MAG: hypothetical protein KJ821_03400 [Actinobacteria bacterium]|nr:hypothetical protein [Actinomycetota bacterium]
MKNSAISIRYGKLKHIEALLSKWVKMHESFCNYSTKDSLYWYNERASISTLAGAVWKCSEFSLEEYRTIKKYRKGSWSGRADLWFTWRKREYYVETKQTWISLSKKSNVSTATGRINKALQNAIKEAAYIEKEEGQALGLVFVIPYIRSTESDHMDSRLKILIEQVEKVNYEIMAYTFPTTCRLLESDNYIYPGVVLVGRTK